MLLESSVIRNSLNDNLLSHICPLILSNTHTIVHIMFTIFQGFMSGNIPVEIVCFIDGLCTVRAAVNYYRIFIHMVFAKTGVTLVVMVI